MDSCQRPLQESASFRFIESVRKATEEGEERWVLMTLLIVFTNEKEWEKTSFLRYTFNLATVLDKKLPVFKARYNDELTNQLGRQKEPLPSL